MNVLRHPSGNGQACGIILGVVDALAGGQLLHRNLAISRGHFKGRLREQRFDVGVNDGHGNLLMGLVARCCAVLSCIAAWQHVAAVCAVSSINYLISWLKVMQAWRPELLWPWRCVLELGWHRWATAAKLSQALGVLQPHRGCKPVRGLAFGKS